MSHIDAVIGHHLLKKKREKKEVFISMVTGYDECRFVSKKDLPPSFDGRALISFHIKLNEVRLSAR